MSSSSILFLLLFFIESFIYCFSFDFNGSFAGSLNISSLPIKIQMDCASIYRLEFSEGWLYDISLSFKNPTIPFASKFILTKSLPRIDSKTSYFLVDTPDSVIMDCSVSPCGKKIYSGIYFFYF
jgi:hypothetical protein